MIAEFVHPNLVRLYELLADAETWAVSMELVEGARPFLDYVRPYRHLVPSAATEDTRTAATTPLSASDATRATDVLPASFTPGDAVPTPVRDAIRAGALNTDRLRDAILQLVRGLDVVHANDMLHRDLKPSNVLVDKVGRVVVCDFGLVTLADKVHRAIAGTPSYMSPEQTEPRRVTAASDYYSVGVMLYEALTGQLPVTAPTASLVIERKRTADIPPPRSIVAGVDERLEALCMALLDIEPGRRPDGEQIRGELRAGPSAPVSQSAPASVTRPADFIGRAHERELLRQAFADARSGTTVTVFVSGPSGVGKSALVAASCEEMQSEHGAVVLAGRCYQTESVPFKALDAVVDELARYLDSIAPAEAAGVLPDDIAALCALFPVLRRVRAVARAVAESSTTAPAHLARTYAQVALRRLLQALAERHPVVIVVDDLQWGDLDSEPFLRELMDSAASPGALILATCRTDAAAEAELPAALRETTGPGIERDFRAVELGPLSVRDASQLVEAIAGPVQTGIVAGILDDAGGNPLFVAELAHAARAGQSVEGIGGLDGLLVRRIEALSAEGQRLLEAAAVVAWPQPLSLLSRALELRGEASVLSELRAARMIRVVQSRDGELLATYHDRVRETAVARLSTEDRRRLHQILARAFEREAGSDHEALAVHWTGAGDSARAGHHRLLAGDKAIEARAYHRAAGHYHHALAHSDLDDDTRARVEKSLARALFFSGAVRDAADAYNRVADAADADARADLRGRALICLLRAGDMAAADRLARSFGAEIGVGVPRSRVGTVASIVWGRLSLALKGSRRLEIEPRPASAAQSLRMAVAKDTATALGLTDPMRGFAVHTHYLRAAMRSGDPNHLATSLAQEALYFAAMRGAAARSRVDALLAAAGRYADVVDSDAYRAMVEGYRGVIDYVWMERLHDSGERLDRVLPRVERDPGFAWEADIVRTYAINTYSRAGAFAHIAERLPAMLKRARDTGDEYLREGLSRQLGVQVHLARGRPDRAYALLERAHPREGGQATINTFFLEVNYAEAHAYEGAWMRGLARMEALWSAIRGTSVARVVPTRGWTTYGLGRMSIVASALDPADRPAHLRRARAMLRAVARLERNMPQLARAMGQTLRALLAACAGDDERCAGHLRRALASYEECQARRYAASVRHQLGGLIGGDDGAALIAEARDWAAAEGVVDFDRFARWTCPVELCAAGPDVPLLE